MTAVAASPPVPALPQVSDPDFTAEAQADGRGLAVRLSGTADLNVKRQLDDFLSGIHEAALGLSATEVTLDLRTLEFMNSSCLKGLVTWISSVQDQTIDKRYRITFVSNPDLHWQRRSLHALSRIAGEIVSILT